MKGTFPDDLVEVCSQNIEIRTTIPSTIAFTPNEVVKGSGTCESELQ